MLCSGSPYSPCETPVDRSTDSSWVTCVTCGATDEPEPFLSQKQKNNNVPIFNSPTEVGGLLKAAGGLCLFCLLLFLWPALFTGVLGGSLTPPYFTFSLKGPVQAYSRFLLVHSSPGLHSALPPQVAQARLSRKSSSLLALGALSDSDASSATFLAVASLASAPLRL